MGQEQQGNGRGEEGEDGRQKWEGRDENSRGMGGGRQREGWDKKGKGGGVGREAGGREGRGSTIYHYIHLLCNLLLSSPIAVKGSRDFDSPSVLGGLLPVAPPPLVEGPCLSPPAPGVG